MITKTQKHQQTILISNQIQIIYLDIRKRLRQNKMKLRKRLVATAEGFYDVSKNISVKRKNKMQQEK